VRPTTAVAPHDTPVLRKERGAFFTPEPVTEFLTAWALREASDRMLEPAAGDAAFLVAAVRRLRALAPNRRTRPSVHGIEIHEPSIAVARERVRAEGGTAHVVHNDFFAVEPTVQYDAVVGNPPYIRYQQFSGEARTRARKAALRGGVTLSGLASSWAAFTVHSAMFLSRGGRLALVLPAELLSVNYAAPVRRFIFDSFREVRLVLFHEQVFPDAEADVVLLLADGYLDGPAGHATIHQARNADALRDLGDGLAWQPDDPASKWTGSLVNPNANLVLHEALTSQAFTHLEQWGDTTLGIVTGNNKFFTLSPQRAREIGIRQNELLRLSPPGSSHLRGLVFDRARWQRLGRQGEATYLFYPAETPSTAALAYIADGHRTGVDTAYKCRIRKTWYRVPLVPPADLLLTCMNADTPRLTENAAGALHLNSVHGVYLGAEQRELGRELLPLASLNSVTLLHAELVGRSYGGGILKLEPREADRWTLPAPAHVAARAAQLLAIKADVAELLQRGALMQAVELVDEVILRGVLTAQQIVTVRGARQQVAHRRTVRGASGR